MALNEIICLPIFVFTQIVEILFGRIPGVIIMYVTSILEKMVKEFRQNMHPCAKHV